MGKDQASLEESRQIRALLKQRWGTIPRSIMQADWSDGAIDLSVSYQDGREASKYAGTAFSLSSIGARHGQLSRFPQNVARWATSFYTTESLADSEPRYFHNELPTVLDPFCGHNSRMEAVFRSGRNYVGWDISSNFMEMNREVREMLLSSPTMFGPVPEIELVEVDSRNIDYPPVFDFCLTSPPYWDLEDYGPEPGQLGHHSNYTFFLDDLQGIAANFYRALKPGAFMACELNEFTKDGVFYPYAFDMMQRFRNVGFVLHQVIIIDYGHGFLSSFAQDIEAHKLVSKEHSYLVVARKAGAKKPRAEVRKDLVEEIGKLVQDGGVERQISLPGFGR